MKVCWWGSTDKNGFLEIYRKVIGRLEFDTLETIFVPMKVVWICQTFLDMNLATRPIYDRPNFKTII